MTGITDLDLLWPWVREHVDGVLAGPVRSGPIVWPHLVVGLMVHGVILGRIIRFGNGNMPWGSPTLVLAGLAVGAGLGGFVGWLRRRDGATSVPVATALGGGVVGLVAALAQF